MKSNDQLVDSLKHQGHIEAERVEKAFRNVDRKDFVPEGKKRYAYSDQPLPIGHDVTISAPHMVAINTGLLDIQPGDSVLEIGSGSGYQLAILAELTREEVTGVERIRDLVEKSREVLKEWDNVEVIHGNGLEAIDGKFDRILFSCGVKSLEPAKEFLAEDGVLVAPVEDNLGQVLTRYRNGKEERHSRVRFVDYQDEPI